MKYFVTCREEILCFAACALFSLCAPACGAKHDAASGTNDQGGVTNCSVVFGGKCDAPCATDVDCKVGSYCAWNGQCAFQCAVKGPSCPAGQACSSNGQCLGNPTGAAVGVEGQPGVCAAIPVGNASVNPLVVVVVDRSNSMLCAVDYQGTCFGPDAPYLQQSDPNTRWHSLYSALFDNPAPAGIVRKYQQTVGFGMITFDATAAACPHLLPASLDPLPAVGNADALDKLYLQYPPHLGGTPTAEALELVVPMLSRIKSSSPKYIVLATDGDPGTCGPTGMRGEVAKAKSVAAVMMAREAGIQTFVIGVRSGDLDTNYLTDVAQAGTPAGRFHPVSSRDEIAKAFDEITGIVRTCSFDLQGQISALDANRGSVTWNGRTLVFDKDWKFTAPARVDLVGGACDAYKAQGGKLDVSFQCGVKIQPVVL